jgi:hypothetical protein
MKDIFKAIIGLVIGAILFILIQYTLAFVVPILLVLAFFGVVLLILKPSK